MREKLVEYRITCVVPIGTFSCFSEKLQYLIYVYQTVVNFGRDLKMDLRECRPLKSSTCPILCLAEEQHPGLRLLQPEIEARSLLWNPQLTHRTTYRLSLLLSWPGHLCLLTTRVRVPGWWQESVLLALAPESRHVKPMVQRLIYC